MRKLEKCANDETTLHTRTCLPKSDVGHVPKSPSAVGSKVITKIVRAEEGEPGDEATKPSAQ